LRCRSTGTFSIRKLHHPGHLSGRVARPLCARSRHGGRHRLTRTPSIRCEILYLTDRNAALASGRRTRPPRSQQDRHRRRCLPGRRIRRAWAFERDPVQQLLFRSRREPVCPPWLPWASAGRPCMATHHDPRRPNSEMAGAAATQSGYSIHGWRE